MNGWEGRPCRHVRVRNYRILFSHWCVVSEKRWNEGLVIVEESEMKLWTHLRLSSKGNLKHGTSISCRTLYAAMNPFLILENYRKPHSIPELSGILQAAELCESSFSVCWKFQVLSSYIYTSISVSKWAWYLLYTSISVCWKFQVLNLHRDMKKFACCCQEIYTCRQFIWFVNYWTFGACWHGNHWRSICEKVVILSYSYLTSTPTYKTTPLSVYSDT